ncbi:hypothetical protein LCGC14_1946850 [marine sediment metagenome]|uniref:Uncharacterized protein n=1 Tax=marine sediment metagenome TaxID=412755 RepID=A0A0F9IFN4_9ZZZZ
MTYDKYRDFPLPITPGGMFGSPINPISIADQVLEDLKNVKDPTEGLEILDSFAAYQKRAYRQELAKSVSDVLGEQLGELLAPVFVSRLPGVFVPHRGRPAQQENTE